MRIAAYRSSTSSAASDDALAERQEPRGVQDLVASRRCRCPATNAWLRSRFLSSPGCLPDPLPPRLERQRRVERVGAHLARRRDPGPAAPRPRAQVDLAHLGRVAVADDRRTRRRRASTPPRRSTRRRPRAGRRSRGPNASSTAVLAGGFSPRAASWKRPVSIGLTTTRSAIEVEVEELARARDRSSTRWPASASSSAGVPRTASGIGRARAPRASGPPGRHGAHRRRRSGRAARARAAIVPAQSAVLDSPGPRARTVEELVQATSREGADRRPRSPRSTHPSPRRPGDVLGAVS